MKKLAIAIVVIFALGAVALGGAYAYVNNQIHKRVEGEYFDSDGVQIHYTVNGSGPPVILLHGFCANIDAQWREPGVIDMLAQDYTVVAMDNRGHGLSGKPHDPAAYGTEFVEDVIRLMDHLNIEKAAVAGYSMGGMITYKLLELYPERLVCAAPCGYGWQTEENLDREFPEVLAASLESGDGIAPLLEALQPEGEEPDMTRRAIVNNLVTRLNDTKALAAVVRSWETLPPAQEAMENNEVPTLCIVGTADPLYQGAQNMATFTNNFAIVPIEGADHMEAFADPKFGEALKAFIDKHYEGASEETDEEPAVADAA